MGSLSVSKAREGVGRRGYIRSRQTGNVRDKDKLIAMPASSSAYTRESETVATEQKPGIKWERE